MVRPFLSSRIVRSHSWALGRPLFASRHVFSYNAFSIWDNGRFCYLFHLDTSGLPSGGLEFQKMQMDWRAVCHGLVLYEPKKRISFTKEYNALCNIFIISAQGSHISQVADFLTAKYEVYCLSRAMGCRSSVSRFPRQGYMQCACLATWISATLHCPTHQELFSSLMIIVPQTCQPASSRSSRDYMPCLFRLCCSPTFP